MSHKKIVMVQDKKITLVAHDNKKRDLLEWAMFNRELLANHIVFATGTTGDALGGKLGLTINKLQSGTFLTIHPFCSQACCMLVTIPQQNK